MSWGLDINILDKAQTRSDMSLTHYMQIGNQDSFLAKGDEIIAKSSKRLKSCVPKFPHAEAKVKQKIPGAE